MTTYVIRRLLLTLLVLLGVSIMSFTLIHLVPGDPALVMLGTDSTPEELTRLRSLLGLDQPLSTQYIRYLSRVMQGQFGDSIIQHQPVAALILERLPATVELALAAILIAATVGTITGVISATRPYSWFDTISVVAALAGVAMPVFWLGMLGILLFSLRLGWLPSFGRGDGLFPSLALLVTQGNTSSLLDSLRHLILPAVTLGAFSTAIIARLVRSSMLEVLGMDYVRTARAKGLGERAVLFRHALRNSLIPVVTVMGLQVGILLGSAVIAETIFAWPGIGRLLIGAINTRDYPLVQGLVFVIALLVSIINLMVDLIYVWLNPRVGYS
jgi:ABC-type dipeptide/oligopeptide/nickel transport system permease component